MSWLHHGMDDKRYLMLTRPSARHYPMSAMSSSTESLPAAARDTHSCPHGDPSHDRPTSLCSCVQCQQVGNHGGAHTGQRRVRRAIQARRGATILGLVIARRSSVERNCLTDSACARNYGGLKRHQSRIVLGRKDGYDAGTRGYLRDFRPRIWGKTRRHINPDALRSS